MIKRVTKTVLEELSLYPEEKRFEILEQYYLENLSKYFFPGSLTAFYPKIDEHHTTRDIICDMSESIIKKGSLYVCYRPLIENLETNEVFVLKRTIKCESSYLSLLPNNIFEFEELNERIKNYAYYTQNEDYSRLHYQQGGELVLQKLR